MRFAILAIAAIVCLNIMCGCGRKEPGGTEIKSGNKVAMVVDIDALRVTPEEIGPGWKYGKEPKSSKITKGGYVFDYYLPGGGTDGISIDITRAETTQIGKSLFDRKASGGQVIFKTGPYAGLGDDARVETLGSKTLPVGHILFRRNNVVASLRHHGSDTSTILRIAQLIDSKAQNNLKMVAPPKPRKKRTVTKKELHKAQKKLMDSQKKSK